MTCLLDRRTAGFTVELHHVDGKFVLIGETEVYAASVEVDPAQALESFVHPCVFLPEADRFFRDPRPEDEEPQAQQGYVRATAKLKSNHGTDRCHNCGQKLEGTEVNTCNDCYQDGA